MPNSVTPRPTCSASRPHQPLRKPHPPTPAPHRVPCRESPMQQHLCPPLPLNTVARSLHCDGWTRHELIVSPALRYCSAILRCDTARRYCAAILRCDTALRYCAAILRCDTALRYCAAAVLRRGTSCCAEAACESASVAYQPQTDTASKHAL